MRNLGKDGEHRPREEPRIPAAQTLATQPEVARAALVSHTSQSVLAGPKVGSWLVRAGRLAQANTALLLSRCSGSFFLWTLSFFGKTLDPTPPSPPPPSAPPQTARERTSGRGRAEGGRPERFPHQSHHGRPQQPALGGAVEPVLLFAATHPGHVLFPGFRKTWPHGPRTALVATAAFEFGRGICMYATP